jgi:hypothetical protein
MSNVIDLIARTSWDTAQRGALSMWTVYDHPRDFPDGFVARRFEVRKGEPVVTKDAITANGLQPLRTAFERAGLTVIARFEGDEPQIVETWM